MQRQPACESAIEPAVRALLDHIAAELTVEYVHLMEAAAVEDRADTDREPPEVVPS
jgi:hypothetical protein